MRRSANSLSLAPAQTDSIKTALEIFGVKVHSLPPERLFEVTAQWLRGAAQHFIVTPNPEMLVAAARTPDLRRALNAADLAPIDGIGITLFSYAVGTPLPHRIAGVDVAEHLLRQAASFGLTVVLFGGKADVAAEAAARLRKIIPELAITGLDVGTIVHPSTINAAAVKRINQLQPSLLMVALGHGKQELFIASHLKHLPSVRIAIGVGGAFDYWAGRVKRAPHWVRRCGFEWLYRFVRQPWRFPRVLIATVIFPLRALISYRYGKRRRHTFSA